MIGAPNSALESQLSLLQVNLTRALAKYASTKTPASLVAIAQIQGQMNDILLTLTGLQSTGSTLNSNKIKNLG
jgi:hypothetical protein